MSEPTIERILAYLREHGGDYQPEQLRAQLLAAGYSSLDVDAAFVRLEAERAGPVPATGATISLPPSDQPVAPLPTGRDPQLPRVLAYIEQNRTTYNEEVLRGALLQSGYSPDVVEEALRRASPGSSPARPRAWPFGILLAVLNSMLISIAFIGEASAGGSLALSAVFAAVLLGGEVIAWLALRNGPRERLGRILLLGALFTVGGSALLGAVGALLIGACIALIYGLGGG